MIDRRIIIILGFACLLVVVGCSTLSEDAAPLSAAAKCNGCHQLPPQDQGKVWTKDTILIYGMHYTHVTEQGLKCNECHYNYDPATNEWNISPNHRTNKIRYDSARCVECHDVKKGCNSNDAGCHASPPTTPPLRKKNHDVHVTREGYKCGVCHKGYDLATKKVARGKHKNGQLDVMFDLSAVNGTPFPVDSLGPPVYTEATGTCARVYCHGTTIKGGRKSIRLTETFSTVKPSKCDACHPKAALGTLVEDHTRSTDHQTQFKDCLVCHNGYSYDLMQVDTTTHINGRFDIYNCHSCHDVIPDPFAEVNGVIKRVK